jgi:hypothetical protein
MQNPSNKKLKTAVSWRQRNRPNLQTVALGLGAVAPFALYFCLQNDHTLLLGIGIALTVVGFNITAWI